MPSVNRTALFFTSNVKLNIHKDSDNALTHDQKSLFWNQDIKKFQDNQLKRPWHDMTWSAMSKKFPKRVRDCQKLSVRKKGGGAEKGHQTRKIFAHKQNLTWLEKHRCQKRGPFIALTKSRKKSREAHEIKPPKGLNYKGLSVGQM